MSTHKHIDVICLVIVCLALLLTLLFMNGEAFGIQAAESQLGYESRLFDTSRVHTLDIVMDDWDGFIETCENEEYSLCAVIIDGESFNSVGIRAKGNTSLRNVSEMGSERYSFKIEFDQYDSTKSYYGLDKLSLNNLIQDNTMMKDYLSYRLMGEFGVDSPLCSYVYIRVNGEDWGLYLAVEGVEDAFLRRNYGADFGELYKPDSMSFGGGRGNGRGFDMGQFMEERDSNNGGDIPDANDNQPSGFDGPPKGYPGDFDPSQFGGGTAPPDGELPGNFEPPEIGGRSGGKGGMGGPGGMGAEDVKLQYIDDYPDSYPNIFDNAKTDVTKADKERLIASLKALSEYEDIESVVDIDEVLRYFVVHNFVVNGDSYTGDMIHNYYLYEENGRLSMIPWDYNLAFGSFMGRDASASVNDPIDEVLDDRPMQAWIFSDESYTEMYHQLYVEFLNTVDIGAIIDEAQALIAPYVEKDPTKFCTYEEFETGAKALKSFCALRAESVRGQLAGEIPSTEEGQRADSGSLVDTGSLDLNDMGSMGSNMGGGFPEGRPSDRQPPDGQRPDFPAA